MKGLRAKLENLLNERDFERDFQQMPIRKKIGKISISLGVRPRINWSFLHPVKNKYIQQRAIYCPKGYSKSNQKIYLKKASRALEVLIHNGFSPYEHGTDNPNFNNIDKALDFALNEKKKVQSETSFVGYKQRINTFKKFLHSECLGIAPPSFITKAVVIKFLNKVHENNTTRTRNNYRIDVSALLQVLEDNEIIQKNPAKSIPKLKSTPQRHKTYTQKEVDKIFETSKGSLRLFLKIVYYAHLRPIEISRLKVKDIDLNEGLFFEFQAKNQSKKTKIIPKVIQSELTEYIKDADPEHWLFGFGNHPSDWGAKETNRRERYTRLFRNVKKKLSLSKDHTIYSLRHTSIVLLYRQFRKEKTPMEAKSKLMQITGHSTIDALNKYLRSINAELPDDYSNYYERTLPTI